MPIDNTDSVRWTF